MRTLLKKLFLIFLFWHVMFGAVGVVHALPSGYTELEYIESTGSQYIDTGVSSNGIGISVETKVMWTSLSYGDGAIFGRNGKGGFEIYADSSNVSLYGNGSLWLKTSSVSTNTIYTISAGITSSGGTLVVNGQTYNSSASPSNEYSASLVLFRHNYKYYAYARMYYLKLYNNGTLVRDFVPALRNSDNVVGMYDKVSGNFFINSGSGSFTAAVYNISYDLSDSCFGDYTNLEYIESTGTQYIYPNVSSNGIGTTVETKVMWTSLSSKDGAILGRDSAKGFELYADSSNVSLYNSDGLWILGPPSQTNTIYTISASITSSGGTLVVNGQTYTSSSTPYNPGSSSLVLFKHANTYEAYARVYYLKLYNNGTLVRNFVPVRRNSDNVVGLYDKVSGSFFTNSGSGSFIAGPTVNIDGCAANYANAPILYVYGTGATINGVPTRTGYTFAGWCTDSALTNCAMTQTISSSATGNKTFYAKWTNSSANIITLTFDGVSTTPSQCTYGGTFVPPTPAARPGYIFSGWKVKTINP